MRIRRRREVIIETERRYAIKTTGAAMHFFCPACNDDVDMLSINQAAARTQIGWRDILGLVEQNAMHSIETENGEIFVCATSLSEIDNSLIGIEPTKRKN